MRARWADLGVVVEEGAAEAGRDGRPLFPPPACGGGCDLVMRQACGLRDALELDDGQMLPAGLVPYFPQEVPAGRAANGGLCSSGPTGLPAGR